MEQRRAGISSDASGDDLFIEALLQDVVTGDNVFLATFFMQPGASAASLHELMSWNVSRKGRASGGCFAR